MEEDQEQIHTPKRNAAFSRCKYIGPDGCLFTPPQIQEVVWGAEGRLYIISSPYWLLDHKLISLQELINSHSQLSLCVPVFGWNTGYKGENYPQCLPFDLFQDFFSWKPSCQRCASDESWQAAAPSGHVSPGYEESEAGECAKTWVRPAGPFSGSCQASTR